MARLIVNASVPGNITRRLVNGFCFLALGCILLALAGPARAKKVKPNEDQPQPATSAAVSVVETEASTLVIEDFHSQVTNNGLLKQDLTAKWARMDEREKVLDLSDLDVKFFDAGKEQGAARSGSGRVWLEDKPAQQITRNDLILKDHVSYHMMGNQQPGKQQMSGLLQSPEMRYSASDSTLRSDKGYAKQIPTADGFIIGHGQGFEIKLQPLTNTFETWTEYGNPVDGTPVVMKKSKGAELIP